jgi:hypothetical protein
VPHGTGATSFAVVDGSTEAVEVRLEVGAGRRVRIRTSDESGVALPATLSIRRTDADARPTDVPDDLLAALGISESRAGLRWVWTATGEADLRLDSPGTYVVEAGHSHRHERASAEIDGEASEVSLVLSEVVPRDGWYSVDPHLHAAPSMDGSLAMEDRIVVCAAAGIDVPVTTDHDRMADYGPVVEALGLRGRMYAMPGVEVTPIVKGHFNLFPVEPDPDAVNGGALRWWDRYPDADALHTAARATAPEGAILQINHGRNALGMFDLAGWTAARVARPDAFTLDFDLMEIVTTEDEEDWIRNRNDWFGLLSSGEVRVPTGASDSHERTHRCGAGRTDVMVPVASVSELSGAAVRDALLGGATVVASGITLRATLDGRPPGSTATGADAVLDIQVLGPSWVRPDVVRVWRNGEVLEERTTAEAVDGVWFDEQISVAADGDSWFVVEVDGSTALGHLWGGSTAYALSNAFFLDAP